MSVLDVGTSPFVSPKLVGVVYFGEPSELKASIEAMNGEAPLAEFGMPVNAVAVVPTCQLGWPMMAAK